MKKQPEMILKAISALVTSAAVYLIVRRFFFLDLVTSLMPGWHMTTNIFSEIGLLLALVMASVLLIYLFLQLIYKILLSITSKLK